MSQATDDINAERRRQIEAEGWTPAHDDEHGDGALANAAACYALGAKLYVAPEYRDGKGVIWPFDEEWWKPSKGRCGRRRDLVKAGALIVAEIERIDRASA